MVAADELLVHAPQRASRFPLLAGEVLETLETAS